MSLMAKCRLIIIEDEFFAANHLKQLVASFGYWVVDMYHSGEEFVKANKWDFDAAIVDIFLSETLTGLDIAAKLQERQKPFLFLTANQDSQTLQQAARLGPKAYISKPFQTNDVIAALEIIGHTMAAPISIRTARGVEELHPSDILYVKSDGVYIEIQTLSESIVQRKLLKEIEQELPASFVRVHRSYIVNTSYIDQRTASTITLRGHELPVSRNYRQNLD